MYVHDRKKEKRKEKRNGKERKKEKTERRKRERMREREGGRKEGYFLKAQFSKNYCFLSISIMKALYFPRSSV